jgi:hypothetical protein
LILVDDLARNKKRLASYCNYLQAFTVLMEAASGFEPEMAILQTAALPLGYAAKKNGAGNGI